MAKSKTEDFSALIERVDNIKENIGKIGEEVDKIEDRVEKIFVSKIEFYSEISPIKKVVYGLISLILVSVAGAILSLVLIR